VPEKTKGAYKSVVISKETLARRKEKTKAAE
jgi:hypothetical protein